MTNRFFRRIIEVFSKILSKDQTAGFPLSRRFAITPRRFVMLDAVLLRRLLLLTVLCYAAAFDLTEYRIPNALTAFSGLVFCLLGIFCPQKPESLPVFGAFCLLLFLFLLRRFGKLGGGDLKLFFVILLCFPDFSGLSMILLSFPASCLSLCFPAIRKNRRLPLAFGALLSCAFSCLLSFPKGGRL